MEYKKAIRRIFGLSALVATLLIVLPLMHFTLSQAFAIIVIYLAVALWAMVKDRKNYDQLVKIQMQIMKDRGEM